MHDNQTVIIIVCVQFAWFCCFIQVSTESSEENNYIENDTFNLSNRVWSIAPMLFFTQSTVFFCSCLLEDNVQEKPIGQ